MLDWPLLSWIAMIIFMVGAITFFVVRKILVLIRNSRLSNSDPEHRNTEE